MVTLGMLAGRVPAVKGLRGSYQNSSSEIPNRRRMARTMWTLTSAPGLWQLSG